MILIMTEIDTIERRKDIMRIETDIETEITIKEYSKLLYIY